MIQKSCLFSSYLCIFLFPLGVGGLPCFPRNYSFPVIRYLLLFSACSPWLFWSSLHPPIYWLLNILILDLLTFLVTLSPPTRCSSRFYDPLTALKWLDAILPSISPPFLHLRNSNFLVTFDRDLRNQRPQVSEFVWWAWFFPQRPYAPLCRRYKGLLSRSREKVLGLGLSLVLRAGKDMLE